MKLRPIHVLALLVLVSSLLSAPRQSAQADLQVTGGVMIHSVLPDKVCVGDQLTLHGAAGITLMEDLPDSLAWLPVTRVDIHAQLGQVTPQQIIQENDFYYFQFTYTATKPGQETLTLTLNDDLASTQETFQVEDHCDYDAYLTEVALFTADMEGEHFQSLSHITGSGTLKRDRQGSQIYQGDGTWHLEEITLSKPSECVQYSVPPLIMSGPFELDGRLADEGDTIDVLLSFLPRQGDPIRHGDAICIDADGNVGTAWGLITEGDPALASKINATFPAGGGSQAVEMTGAGLEMVQSVGDLDYTATLTLLPH
ncbi:hypothetical protein LARV_03478 [Longilinea arvoryzae]|uniref:DUF4198 domain-containing protein n=1 Tax=Longilinea arvoryzae TaxID=360412 RepID=A0A0S7BMD2_9CHLR|nr:hypothetical protein [Longilinea arvoryzae]GAP15686.1 hypothetical protein LARV_03478 [Longilinea arvoryzae]